MPEMPIRFKATRCTTKPLERTDRVVQRLLDHGVHVLMGEGLARKPLRGHAQGGLLLQMVGNEGACCGGVGFLGDAHPRTQHIHPPRLGVVFSQDAQHMREVAGGFAELEDLVGGQTQVMGGLLMQGNEVQQGIFMLTQLQVRLHEGNARAGAGRGNGHGLVEFGNALCGVGGKFGLGQFAHVVSAPGGKGGLTLLLELGGHVVGLGPFLGAFVNAQQGQQRRLRQGGLQEAAKAGFGTVEDAVAAMTSTTTRYEPTASGVAVYDERYRAYAQIYPALRPVFASTAGGMKDAA